MTSDRIAKEDYVDTAVAGLSTVYQPKDADLTTIAGLTATTDNFLISVASAWASRTPAQAKTTLSLNNVDNTSDATKNSASVTLTNKTLTSPVLNTGVSGTAVDTDSTMAANSDTILASQKATKTALALKANVATPTFGGPVTITAAAALLIGAPDVSGAIGAVGSICAQSGGLGLTFIATEYNGAAGTLDLRGTRGTSIASPSQSLSGDVIAIIRGGGGTASGLVDCFSMKWRATQNFTTSAAGTALDINTVPNNSTTHTLALTVGQDQSLSAFGGVAVTVPTSSTTALLTLGTAATYTATQTIGDTSNIANTFATTASMQHFGFRLRETDTWAVTPGALGAHTGFSCGVTIVNDSATAFNYTIGYVAFVAGNVLKVDTQTGRNLGTSNDFQASAGFQVANSGTFTAGVHRGFIATPTMNAASSTLTSTTAFQSGLTVTSGTVTTRTGLLISEATGAGSLTNQYGIDIVALTKGGTTNVGIRNASSTQLGSSQQLTVDTSGNLSTSGSLTTTGSGTLTVAGHATLEGVTSTGATGTGKFVFDGTPTLVTPVIGAATGTSLAVTGAITSSGGGIGSAGGGGATHPHHPPPTTTVINNNQCGNITLFAAVLNADTTVTFTLTNSAIAANDMLIMQVVSGAGVQGAYTVNGRCGSGTAQVDVHNHTPTNSASESPVIKFTVIKGVTT